LSDSERRGRSILARERDDEVSQQIEPEAQAGKESCFVARAVAEELQGCVAVCAAEVGRVEAQ
jgi:hypothetical protein